MAEIFNYNKEYFGGTEWMAKNFQERVLPECLNFFNYNTVILPCGSDFFADCIGIVYGQKDTLAWLHNPLDQFNPAIGYLFSDPRVLKRIKYLVVVSDWLKKVVVKQTGIDPKKVIVINNAVDSVKYDKNKFDNVDKVKIIHTASPDRAMRVLLESLQYVEEDFELDIYNEFIPDVPQQGMLQSLQNFQDDRVTFHGRTPRKTVQKALEQSHIYAYPATFEETFCISQAEALSAGCLCVYNDMGALKEISNGFGQMYKFDAIFRINPQDPSTLTARMLNEDEHAKVFAEHLTKAIKTIKNKNHNPDKQVETINKKYSWDVFVDGWKKLHDLL